MSLCALGNLYHFLTYDASVTSHLEITDDVEATATIPTTVSSSPDGIGIRPFDPENTAPETPPDLSPSRPHLKTDPVHANRISKPLCRQGAFYHTSHPDIFWLESWGPKPPATRGMARGGLQ